MCLLVDDDVDENGNDHDHEHDITTDNENDDYLWEHVVNLFLSNCKQFCNAKLLQANVIFAKTAKKRENHDERSAGKWIDTVHELDSRLLF